jgi:acyl-CoA thioester hydrolase
MDDVFVHRLRVRYSECDQQGVVFNGHYFFYYDVALTEMWRAKVCDFKEMIGQGYDVVVAETRLRFYAGAVFDDWLDIEVPVVHLGTTSMVIRPVFRVAGRLLADGEVRHVFIDPATNAKRAMPEDVRTLLEPELAATR